MANVVIYADTIRSPALRHEVPIAAPDGLVYAEQNGSRYAFIASLEVPRLERVSGLEAVPFERLGLDELIAAGTKWHEYPRELTLRACRELSLKEVVTPRDFPLEIADYLREQGIRVTTDGELFDRRRRVKTDAELAGIRKAQRGAERAMDAIRARLREGGAVACEDLHAEATKAFTEAGLMPPDLLIASHGPQTAVGHEPGSGAISPGEAVLVDLTPKDPDSGCFADMTRTFCVGDSPDELVEMHGLCREALDLALAEIRPGVTGAELHRKVSSFFEEHGYATQYTKEPGNVLEDGFHHSLGHGVGLEVHELPGLGRNGEDLVAGDVVAVEPGLYRKGFGGCRLEDLVLVTHEGFENLTAYPYDLAP